MRHHEDDSYLRVKRVVLYARVSSDEQAKKGYSLKGQLRQLRLHAEESGYEVLDEAVDDGFQGDTLRRPGITLVRHLVKEARVDLVLATERDRLARKRGYVFMLEEELREHGCALLTLEDTDEDTAEQHLMRAIKDEFAEYEHAKIAERTFSKKLEKARGGEVIAGRTPNYGFRYNEARNKYLVDEEKMALVRRAFEMIGAEGQTSYAVVRWLEGAHPHGPTGKGWNLPFVRKMVFNDVYKSHPYEEAMALVPPEAAWRLTLEERYGIWWFNRTRFEPKRTPPEDPGDFKRKYKPVVKPREEWIAVPSPTPESPQSSSTPPGRGWARTGLPLKTAPASGSSPGASSGARRTGTSWEPRARGRRPTTITTTAAAPSTTSRAAATTGGGFVPTLWKERCGKQSLRSLGTRPV